MWASPWFKGAVLETELTFRRIVANRPGVLGLIAQLDEADLYPGMLDLIASAATPDIGSRIQAFLPAKAPTWPTA